MSKTILTKIDGWTPLPDLLVTKYGLTTAAVWASAWRFCQMSDGVCRASIEKIGARIDLSRQSTMKHMQILVDDGFFEDTTPNLKNKPHIYRDTGKVGMYNRLGISVNEVDSGVNLVDSQSQVSLHEDSIKESNKDINEEEGKNDAKTQHVFELYSQEIGPLTLMIAQSLEDDEKEHGPVWVCEAIKIASKRGARNYSYVSAILKRWKVDGYGTELKRNNGKSNEPKGFDAVRSWAEKQGVNLDV